ncbi:MULTISPECIES: DNA cytosine methyltransferase [unclassified Bradyrhizobium]|uniref:DNA cytosine methyltransferase n=1 Tax=unclassified Bradyrhizobium TaxID=2631580 RepID=UPI0028EFA768|nr:MULTISPECIES: DNA cytosine methyltransferase [unclassified Bradyrhizobium]
MSHGQKIGIELFAGCGGLSTGFLDAGLHIAAGFEIDRRAVDAFCYNHEYRGSKGFVADLATASGSELLELSGLSSIDFLIGGPPCQPFSIVGKRRGAADERADLMGHYVRLVGELRPKAIVLENVPNLAKLGGGEIFEQTMRGLSNLGYGIWHDVLSAADFGVPQARKRLIVIGILGRKNVRGPTATHGPNLQPYTTTKQAIGDLPDAGEFGSTGIHNHEPTMHSADMVERFRSLQQGRRERGSFHDRLHPDRLSYTLRAGSGNFSPLRPIHYKYDRVVTVRESARLQGFSDDFIWPDRIPRLQQYRQVGNAVPPPLAAAIAQCVAEQMRWTLSPRRFKGDPTNRAAPMTMSDEERVAQRKARMRGASLGKVALASAAE